MKTIYVGFSKPKSGFQPFSWAIRLWEGTEYSHVYIRIPSAFLETDMIYQASGLAVNMMSVQTFENHAEILEEYAFDITDETEKALLKSALEKLGVKYGIKQIFGIAFARINAIIGDKAESNPFTDGRSAYVCSELAAEVLVQFIGLKIKKDLDLVLPKDINKKVRKYGRLTRRGEVYVN